MGYMVYAFNTSSKDASVSSSVSTRPPGVKKAPNVEAAVGVRKAAFSQPLPLAPKPERPRSTTPRELRGSVDSSISKEEAVNESSGSIHTNGSDKVKVLTDRVAALEELRVLTSEQVTKFKQNAESVIKSLEAKLMDEKIARKNAELQCTEAQSQLLHMHMSPRTLVQRTTALNQHEGMEKTFLRQQVEDLQQQLKFKQDDLDYRVEVITTLRETLAAAVMDMQGSTAQQLSRMQSLMVTVEERCRGLAEELARERAKNNKQEIQAIVAPLSPMLQSSHGDDGKTLFLETENRILQDEIYRIQKQQQELVTSEIQKLQSMNELKTSMALAEHDQELALERDRVGQLQREVLSLQRELQNRDKRVEELQKNFSQREDTMMNRLEKLIQVEQALRQENATLRSAREGAEDSELRAMELLEESQKQLAQLKHRAAGLERLFGSVEAGRSTQGL